MTYTYKLSQNEKKTNKGINHPKRLFSTYSTLVTESKPLVLIKGVHTNVELETIKRDDNSKIISLFKFILV